MKQSSLTLEALDRDLRAVGLTWRSSKPATSILFLARVPGIFVESLEKKLSKMLRDNRNYSIIDQKNYESLDALCVVD